jgi:hypothetical protein
MISIDPELVSCGDAAEGAALGLLGLMTGISEEYWCAGWMTGLEHSLWRVTAGTAYGQGIITERQATLLRLLSDECDGWWIWNETKGPVFLTIEDWLEEIARREERTK